MPVELEKKLWARAKKLYPGDNKRQNAYVYGTLRDMGWKKNKARKIINSNNG